MRYLGIDIGGTFIKYALLDENAQIFEKSKVKTPLEKGATFQDFMNILEGIVLPFQEQISGIAISMAGILDNQTGHAFTGGAVFYLSGKNLVELLQERFGIPVTIENDGKSAALAELWKGSLKGCQNAAVVLLGTGVGGGVIIDGKLYSGSAFAAGEFSYLAVDSEKVEQAEGYWGEQGSVRWFLHLVSQETGIPLSELDGVKAFEMANQKNEQVLSALDKYTRNLAIQIYNIQALLDLERIAIGGGISQQPLLLSYIQKNAKELSDNNPARVIAPVVPEPTIITCKFYNDSNVIGALYHHLHGR